MPAELLAGDGSEYCRILLSRGMRLSNGIKAVFEETDTHTRRILFSYKNFAEMDKEERIHVCYLHCCLQYVNREPMNNPSLRSRFGIEDKNK